MKKTLLLGISLLLALGACQPSEKEQEDKLYKEVMNIHDETMPDMETIMSLNETLRKEVDSLQAEDSLKAIYQQHITDLNEADKAMMRWMREFKVEYSKMEHEAVMNYLKKEKEKINQVKSEMQEAIQKANKLLEKDSIQ